MALLKWTTETTGSCHISVYCGVHHVTVVEHRVSIRFNEQIVKHFFHLLFLSLLKGSILACSSGQTIITSVPPSRLGTGWWCSSMLSHSPVVGFLLRGGSPFFILARYSGFHFFAAPFFAASFFQIRLAWVVQEGIRLFGVGVMGSSPTLQSSCFLVYRIENRMSCLTSQQTSEERHRGFEDPCDAHGIEIEVPVLLQTGVFCGNVRGVYRMKQVCPHRFHSFDEAVVQT